MKSFVLAAALACLIAASVSAIVIPSVPRTITYQGRLTDGSGNPLTGGYLVRFQIYNAPTGGVTLWDNGYRKINAAAGLFTYNLGDSTALPYSIFTSDTNCWLGITVGADPEISPRTKLNAVPYAYKASTADSANFAVVANAVTDAPGFAMGPEGDGIPITTADVVLTSTLFSPPANGYVLVISEAEFSNNNANNYVHSILIRNGTLGVDTWDWDPGDADGFFDLSQTKVSVDTVSAGNLYSYALHVNLNNGTAAAYYSRVIVVYFPRRYDVLVKPFTTNGPVSASLDNILRAAGLGPNAAAGTRKAGVPATVNPASELQNIKSARDALDARIKRLEEAVGGQRPQKSESTKSDN